MNNYLVPANTKKSILILGILRWIDIIILIVGIAISIILLAIVNGEKIWLIIIACIPMLVALVLILPIPYYHNTLVAIQSIIRYFNENRSYIWKGWCIYDEFKEKE